MIGGLGNVGNNILDGGSGNDTVASFVYKKGRDTLTGGSGDDIFTLGSPEVDIITDFLVADDGIVYSGRYAFEGGLKPEATITPEQFRLGSSARDSSDRFIYNPGTGALFIDIDGRGGAAQEQFAQLSPDLAMTYADISIGPV